MPEIWDPVAAVGTPGSQANWEGSMDGEGDREITRYVYSASRQTVGWAISRSFRTIGLKGAAERTSRNIFGTCIATWLLVESRTPGGELSCAPDEAPRTPTAPQRDGVRADSTRSEA